MVVKALHGVSAMERLSRGYATVNTVSPWRV
jgi:hypothetical protein